MDRPTGVTILAVLNFIGAAFSILLAILLGWGMWKLKNWARIITIVLCALGALGALAGVAIAAMAGQMISAGFNLVFLLIYAWIIWYLLRPHVKEAFGVG